MFMLASDARLRPAPRFTLPGVTPPPRTKWLGALGSIAIHGVTVGAAVLLTMPRTEPAAPERTIDLDPRVPFREPPGRPEPDGARGPSPIERPTVPLIPPVDAPTGIPPIPETATGWPLPNTGEAGDVALPGDWEDGLGGSLDGVFERAVVDEPPALLWSPRREYPRQLLQAGLEGTVIVEVVIDTLGLAELETLRVTASPHPALSRAARDVIARSRYRPGRLGGRPVRVVVRMPVVFEISK